MDVRSFHWRQEKLENILTSVGGIASAANCELIRLDYQQSGASGNAPRYLAGI